MSNTIHLIPEVNLPRLDAAIAKLSRKAKKFHGWEFTPLVIGYQDIKGTRYYEVCVDSPVIEIGGWTFLARVDHSQPAGNLIDIVPNLSDITIPEQYRTAAPDCHHCGFKRTRAFTYLVRHEETGEIKQVGSTCLSDFLGVDANDIAARLTYVCDFSRMVFGEDEEAEFHDSMGVELKNRNNIPLATFLEYTARSIRKFGWVSRATARDSYEDEIATADDALHSLYNPRGAFPKAEDKELAKAALEWAIADTEDGDLNNYLANVRVISRSVVISHKMAGVAASIIQGYIRHQNKLAAEAKKNVKIADMSIIMGLFDTAKSKLKFPKVKLMLDDGSVVVLSVAGERAKFPHSINMASEGSYGNNTWYGRIHCDGTYQPTAKAPADLEAKILEFASAPADTATRFGKLTGQCCFCNGGLSDERSLAVGYGKTCAKNWNLPWGSIPLLAEG